MTVSVVVPTYNGAAYLPGLLSALGAQTVAIAEVVIIDSSSDDSTAEIVADARAGGMKIDFVVIPKREFRHGPTRNMAAARCTGDVIVFTVQDALPVGEGWLEGLIAPFRSDERVACVFCRHIARRDATPITRRQIDACFDSIRSGEGYTYQRADAIPGPYGSNQRKLWFNSDVCSAVRSRVFSLHPFPDVPYGEDQAMGRQLLDLGYTKVYADHVVVAHSHQYPLREYFRRCFDENRGLAVSTGLVNRVSALSLPARVFLNWAKDAAYMARRREKRLGHWLLYSFAFHTLSQVGFLLGKHYRLMPPALQRKLSLEGTAYGRDGAILGSAGRGR